MGFDKWLLRIRTAKMYRQTSSSRHVAAEIQSLTRADRDRCFKPHCWRTDYSQGQAWFVMLSLFSHQEDEGRILVIEDTSESSDSSRSQTK